MKEIKPENKGITFVFGYSATFLSDALPRWDDFYCKTCWHFFLTRQNDSCAFDELLIRSREVIRSWPCHRWCWNRILCSKSTSQTRLIHSSLSNSIIPNQTRAQALKHYSTKVDYIRTNLETLEDTIQKKRENMNYLVNVIQNKIQTQTKGGPQG